MAGHKLHLSKTNYYNLNSLEFLGITTLSRSPFGDGNCGLYAFICGCIQAIIEGELIINDNDFKALIGLVKKYPSLVKTPKLEKELQSDFNQFNKLINKLDLTFAQFKNFLVKSPLTRSKLAAVNLIFAPALRFLGATAYYETCKRAKIPKEELPKEDQNLFQNGQWVTADFLHSLAEKCRIRVKLLTKTQEAKYRIDSSGDPKKKSLFTLLLADGHWYHIKAESTYSKEIKKLREEIGSATTLSKFSETLETLSDILKFTYDYETEEKELQRIGQEVNLAAQESINIINTWRKNWQNDGHQLNIQGLHETQQALILGPFIMDNSVDAAIAAILQAIELLKVKEFIARKSTTSVESSTKSLNPSALYQPCSLQSQGENTKQLTASQPFVC